MTSMIRCHSAVREGALIAECRKAEPEIPKRSRAAMADARVGKSSTGSGDRLRGQDCAPRQAKPEAKRTNNAIASRALTLPL